MDCTLVVLIHCIVSAQGHRLATPIHVNFVLYDLTLSLSRFTLEIVHFAALASGCAGQQCVTRHKARDIGL